jgi:hypothetical protein
MTGKNKGEVKKIADFSNHLDSGESVAKPTAYNTS